MSSEKINGFNLIECFKKTESFLQGKQLSIKSQFSKEEIDKYAEQASQLIASLSQGHMFTPTPEELIGYFKEGNCLTLVDEQGNLQAFVKMMSWKLGEKVKVWELGSLVVNQNLQGNGLGHYLVFKMLEQHFEKEENKDISVIAVVTADNEKSLRVFRSLPFFQQWPIDYESSNDFIDTKINGINIFEEWGIPSEVFITSYNSFVEFYKQYEQTN